jgi:hypothetical protein
MANVAEHPSYTSWASMKARCRREEHPYYSNYGGRGIDFCARWESFAAFVEDMGERPQDHTLERIDSDKNYSAQNCRWATYKEQAENRRSTVWLEHDGQTMTMSDWARHLGVSNKILSWRLNHGWSVSRTLTTPVRGAQPSRASYRLRRS